MVDGPLGGMGTAGRLESLRKYNGLLREGNYYCVEDRSIEVNDTPWERMWSTGGAVAYSVRRSGGGQLVVYVPPSVIDGTEGHLIEISLDAFNPGVTVVTDYSQDVLIAVDQHIADCRYGTAMTVR